MLRPFILGREYGFVKDQMKILLKKQCAINAPNVIGNLLKILVIDEASMMSAKMLFVLDAIGREIRKIDRPFGGIQVVLTCDFYQLPPVETPGDEDSGKFCFEYSNYYDLFPLNNHIVLTKIFRQTDETYISILNEIRRGEIMRQTHNFYINM